MPSSGLERVDWANAAQAVIGHGWARLEGIVEAAVCAHLEAAAPANWEPEPDTVGSVRQKAVSTGLYFDQTDAIVQCVGLAIVDGLTAAFSPGAMPVPQFNEVQWSRSLAGTGHSITAHRDPPLCGGVVAIVTLFGQARFRVWGEPGPVEWDTGAGDVVLLRGNGWPTEHASCPVHEAELPAVGERMTVTYRYNKGGAGADYFA